ncbi:hypothetical protein CHUAL_003892 [Chamberlinius hualienensis]
MFNIVFKFLLAFLIILPAVIQVVDKDQHLFAYAEDEIDDDDGQVESEDAEQVAESNVVPSATDDGDGEDDEYKPLKPSPNTDSHFLFVKPTGTNLPAGKLVDVLVGFTNKGPSNFHIDTIDASFRYPMDYSFYIQNFSVIYVDRLVKPTEQVTLAYSFVPSESFASRPFGLTVNLNYHDTEGNAYLEAVFNETVNIIELDEGLDGETVFLYVFLAACVVLLAVVGQQMLASYGRKRPSKSKPVEVGTSNPNDVDFDWLPEQTRNEINKGKLTPKTTPKQSPRQRLAKRNKGGDD